MGEQPWEVQPLGVSNLRASALNSRQGVIPEEPSMRECVEAAVTQRWLTGFLKRFLAFLYWGELTVGPGAPTAQACLERLRFRVLSRYFGHISVLGGA